MSFCDHHLSVSHHHNNLSTIRPIRKLGTNSVPLEDTQDPQTVYGNSKPSKKMLLLFRSHFAHCNKQYGGGAKLLKFRFITKQHS